MGKTSTVGFKGEVPAMCDVLQWEQSLRLCHLLLAEGSGATAAVNYLCRNGDSR
jgi:hypothetical protein